MSFFAAWAALSLAASKAARSLSGGLRFVSPRTQARIKEGSAAANARQIRFGRNCASCSGLWFHQSLIPGQQSIGLAKP